MGGPLSPKSTGGFYNKSPSPAKSPQPSLGSTFPNEVHADELREMDAKRASARALHTGLDDAAMYQR